MTEAPATLPPLSIDVRVVALVSSTAERVRGVELGGKRTASVTFTFDEVSRDGLFQVVTSYDVRLQNEDGEDAARVKTTFVTQFDTAEEFPEDLSWEDAARVQLAAAEASHPYHRDLIVDLTEALNVPPYRLSFGFRRDDFLAQVAAEYGSAAGSHDQTE